MVQHNTPFDQKAKEVLPEGTRLTTDRYFKAKDTTTDFEEWKKNPRRRDLQGFDTPDAKEPSIRQATEDLTGMPTGYQALMAEPERFIDPSYESGRLLEGEKDNIYDLQSFVAAVKRSWSNDPSLPNLLESVSGDEPFIKMFEQKKVQDWVAQNLGYSYLQKKLNIEPQRAKSVWNNLTIKQRMNVLKKANKPIRIKTKKVKTATIKRIRQVSAKGIEYKRSKPKRFSEMEIEFIQSRKNQSYRSIISDYQKYFGRKGILRSESSLKNKIYRLKR